MRRCSEPRPGQRSARPSAARCHKKKKQGKEATEGGQIALDEGKDGREVGGGGMSGGDGNRWLASYRVCSAERRRGEGRRGKGVGRGDEA